MKFGLNLGFVDFMDLRKEIWIHHIGTTPEGLCQVCHMLPVQYENYHQVRYLPSQTYSGEHLRNWTVACSQCNSKYNAGEGVLKLMLNQGYLRNSDHQEIFRQLQMMISMKCQYHLGKGKYCHQLQIDSLNGKCKYHWNTYVMPMDTTL